MTTEELKNMIQLYFDGELERNKESLLFTSLTQDTESRDYFKSMYLLKNTIEETGKEFPQQLEERIFYSLKKKEMKSSGSFNKTIVNRIISYSIAAILIIINIYLLGRLSSYGDQMNAVKKVADKQNQMIELLYNSLPATEIKAKWENEIIIKANL